MHASAQVQETIAKLVPGGEPQLSHLSDDELLTSTRRLVGASNKLFAQLLLHLAEVETRGIHRARACSSLYTYCIYELRMSEDAAARRSAAARLVRQFPILFDAIARGELHLTGLLMLGPHLTPENHVEVLARAKFRTKKELAKLVRELCPLPLVPDLVEPLRPEPPRSLRPPTWEEWVTSLCPAVRELKPGETPWDWANDDVPSVDEEVACIDGTDDGPRAPADNGSTAPARRELTPITAPQQYRMQICATEEHVQLIERAKALLARSAPGVSLGELHLQAMKLLVDKLEKEKFAVTERARRAPQPVPAEESTPVDSGAPAKRSEAPRSERGRAPAARVPEPARPVDQPEQTSAAQRRRGRHIPAAVKREVFARDAGCCSYTDARGVRCHETRYLELHHVQPFARGGEHVATNLALRCAAHNAIAAEDDFGRGFIEHKRRPARHDSLATQARGLERLESSD